MFYESDAMFDTSFDILVVLFFVCFFGVIGYVVVKVVVQWNRNNHSPFNKCSCDSDCKEGRCFKSQVCKCK